MSGFLTKSRLNAEGEAVVNQAVRTAQAFAQGIQTTFNAFSVFEDKLPGPFNADDLADIAAAKADTLTYMQEQLNQAQALIASVQAQAPQE